MLHAICLQRDVAIVGKHAIEELFALLMGERRSFRLQGIEYDRGVKFIIIVVGKLKRQVGKAKAIKLLNVAHTAHLGTVAICNKRE